MKALIVVLALAACATPPPGLLEACGQRTVPPQPPRSGTRNLTNVVAWANQLQLAREATDRTLAECSARHDGLVAWVKQH